MVLQKLKLSVLHAVVLVWKPALLGRSSALLLRPREDLRIVSPLTGTQNTPANLCASAVCKRPGIKQGQSFGGRETWAQIPAQPNSGLILCMTLGKWISLSRHPFPHLRIRENNAHGEHSAV